MERDPSRFPARAGQPGTGERVPALSFDPRVDYYTSRMQESYGFLLSRVFARTFGHVRVEPKQVALVKDLEKRGTVVYCMRTKSVLDYLCANWVFLREGLPLAHFANGTNLSFWQPLGTVLRTTAMKLGYYLRGSRLPDPRASGYLETLCREGKSSIVFLSRGESLLDKWLAPLWDPVLALVEAQEKIGRPIYLVPQVLFFHRRPETLGRTFSDILFGPTLDPGRLKHMISFLRGYRRASMTFAEPIDLAAFLADHREVPRERLARLIRLSLRTYLYREIRVTVGPTKKPRSRTRQKILAQLRADLAEIARRDGRPLPEVARKAEKMLDEIAADTRPRWLEFLSAIFLWIFQTLFRRVHTLPEDMNRVRAHLKRAPLVLVSSHKSHLDYLLISCIFYNHDITPPHIAAGVNLSFWPLGVIFRRAGAFFIRRSFSGSRLYPEVFKKYLRYMIREGYSIEFFIEGGRSRTGRLRPPKYGLLQMLVESYLEGGIDNLYVVPIAINFDKVPEDRAHAGELSGRPKNPESVGQLLRLARVLTERFGRVHLRVGEIFSLEEYVKRHLPGGGGRGSPVWKPFLEGLGLRISERINRVTPVTSTSLVSAVLLASRDLPLSLESLALRQGLLLEALGHVGAPLGAPLGAPENALLEATRLLSRFGLVRTDKGDQTLHFAPDPEERLTLAYYRNTISHHLRGIAEVCQAFLFLGLGEHLRPQIYQAMERLDLLYAREFVNSPESNSRTRFDPAMAFLERRGVLRDRPGGRVLLVPEHLDTCSFLSGLLGDLAEGYRFVLEMEHLRGRRPGRNRDRGKALLAAGRRAIATGAIGRREAVSREILENAATSLEHLSAAERDGLVSLLSPVATGREFP